MRYLNALDMQYRSVNMRSCFALPIGASYLGRAAPTAFKVAKHCDRDGYGRSRENLTSVSRSWALV